MEDPIRFDVWGTIAKGAFAVAKDELQSSDPGLPRLELLKRINKSIVEHKLIRVVTGIDWSQAQELLSNRPAWLESAAVFQEGYGPEDAALHFCPAHNLYYGGILGCHVCRGDHAGT